MKIIYSIILVTSIVFSQAWAQENRRPELEKLEPEMRLIVTEFLTTDCFVPIFDLHIPLERASSQLEPVFWEAYLLGPANDEVEIRRGVLDKQYESYRQWLMSDGRKVLGESMSRKLKAISREEFIDRGIANYNLQYRDAALAGLGIVCSAACDIMLQRIADDQKAPGRFAAKAARTRLKSRL